jgi:hypothetical protein
VEDASTSTPDADIALEIKCSKPALSYTLAAKATSSIAALKEQLAQEQGRKAPSVDDQRWLLKGKVMADAKLLREYSVADGAKITLMLKPGSSFDPDALATPAAATDPPRANSHARVPSLTLNLSNLEPEITIGAIHAHPAGPSPAFTSKISSVDFWSGILDKLTEDLGEADAPKVFESWFGSSKQYLTPNDVAKIRDALQMTNMGGV